MGEHQLNPENWVDTYADYLYNYAISRVNNEEMAKDLVQEAFFAGLKSAKNFKGQATERTWLVAILKRKIIDYYRKKNSKKGRAEVKINFDKSEGPQDEWLENMVAGPSSSIPHNVIENEELGIALFHCIDLLPPKQGRAFRMKTLDDIGTEEICNILSINPSNLWVMIHRARQSLMNCLNEKWFKL